MDNVNNRDAHTLSRIYIPPKPGIFEAINDCEADLEAIADLIAQDPGISAAVIKIVNSPVFGLANPIASIQQAVVMLGLDRIVAILKTLHLRRSMDALKNNINMELFWDTSLAVANTASTICRQLNLSLADEAYTLGLFHNCGIPILAARFDNYQKVMEYGYSREDGRVVGEEFAEFGVHHAAAGYRVARVWHLPKNICLAIKNHHSVNRILDDKSIQNPTMKTVLCVLKMAETLVNLPEKMAQVDVNFEWQICGPRVLDFMGLSEYDFQDLEDAVSYILKN